MLSNVTTGRHGGQKAIRGMFFQVENGRSIDGEERAGAKHSLNVGRITHSFDMVPALDITQQKREWKTNESSLHPYLLPQRTCLL